MQRLYPGRLPHRFFYSRHGNSHFWRNVSFSGPLHPLPGNKTFGAIRRKGAEGIRLDGGCGSFNLPRMSGVTRILERVEKGDPKAAEELLPLVYGELRRLAAHLMTGERPGHTLQPTALVHEARLRLGGDAQPQWQNRALFFGAAAEAMRRILVEHARRRLRAKRGGGVEPLDVNQIEIASSTK